MRTITYKRIIFSLIIVAGIGLTIGGVFVPVLAPIGAVLIATGVAAVQNLSQPSEPQAQPADPAHLENFVAEIGAPEAQGADNLDLQLDSSNLRCSLHFQNQPSNRPEVRQDQAENKGVTAIHRPSHI